MPGLGAEDFTPSRPDACTTVRRVSGLFSTLVFLHVVGDVVWIGSILAVAVVLTSRHGSAVQRGEMALEIYKKLSNPGFITAFSAGVVRLVMSAKLYFVATHYMHGKLLLALLVIGLHHALGARAKKMATGAKPDAGPAGTLAVVLLVCTVGVVLLVILKPF